VHRLHRLAPGDGLHLCGVFIASNLRLVGHSDADAGLHALTDAVLGAAGLGDIGDHFPPSDMQWKGADSARFLTHALDLAGEAGLAPVHCDVTLICERPKIGPHKDAMKARLAALMGLRPEREHQGHHHGRPRLYRARGRAGGPGRGHDEDAMSVKLAQQVLDMAREAGIKLTAAESCTGGLVMAALTDPAGASDVVDRGFVTYSNAAKSEMLGVAPELIEAHGAVSQAVAQAMAEGALARSNAGLAVSITGIAGPGGGSADKPVGLVWFALARNGEPTLTLEKRFTDPTRAGVRAASVETALELLRDALA